MASPSLGAYPQAYGSAAPRAPPPRREIFAVELLQLAASVVPQLLALLGDFHFLSARRLTELPAGHALKQTPGWIQLSAVLGLLVEAELNYVRLSSINERQRGKSAPRPIVHAGALAGLNELRQTLVREQAPSNSQHSTRFVAIVDQMLILCKCRSEVLALLAGVASRELPREFEAHHRRALELLAAYSDPWESCPPYLLALRDNLVSELHVLVHLFHAGAALSLLDFKEAMFSLLACRAELHAWARRWVQRLRGELDDPAAAGSEADLRASVSSEDSPATSGGGGGAATGAAAATAAAAAAAAAASALARTASPASVDSDDEAGDESGAGGAGSGSAVAMAALGGGGGNSAVARFGKGDAQFTPAPLQRSSTVVWLQRGDEREAKTARARSKEASTDARQVQPHVMTWASDMCTAMLAKATLYFQVALGDAPPEEPSALPAMSMSVALERFVKSSNLVSACLLYRCAGLARPVDPRGFTLREPLPPELDRESVEGVRAWPLFAWAPKMAFPPLYINIVDLLFRYDDLFLEQPEEIFYFPPDPALLAQAHSHSPAKRKGGAPSGGDKAGGAGGAGSGAQGNGAAGGAVGDVDTTTYFIRCVEPRVYLAAVTPDARKRDDEGIRQFMNEFARAVCFRAQLHLLRNAPLLPSS